MERQALVQYLDQYLRISEINDYGPQGLQVETDNEQVNKIALAVDVSPQILQTAAQWGADMLLVHHGIFWRNVEKIIGPLGERVRLMMKHGLNLYAAHLPLDAHPEVGNNAVLARMFGLQQWEWWCEPTNVPLGVVGNVEEMWRDDLVTAVNTQLHTEAQLLPHGAAVVKRVAILSGFGADKIAQVKALGADTYITGETSHAQYWLAADYGLNVIYAGHYATETVGVQALGQHLSEKFDVETQFLDFPTMM